MTERKETESKPKAIVIISGGMDSGTLLYKVVSEGYNVEAISFNYGQRHKKELMYAAKLCANLGVPHRIVDISVINELLQGSALTSSEVEVPEGHYTDETMRATVVPNRNAIMLSLAFGLAVSRQAEIVAYAAHSGDHPIYPDCRPEFLNAFNEMEKVATEGYSNPKLYLYDPFMTISKADIVKEGIKLGVPYEDTWSCYKGRDIHCGRCGTCVERKEAFELANVEDPTIYEY